ncbi:hypothetical protein FA95DRAFT_597038 [Auriscalpium vulgare]|uniref:Uncharacterized protein n=1 Tax=Auriscalpium vulgare TaxID=40419 RepID=A0ACB8S346_9AGAM|nr:hypothetical protein FA95DRAFT_597038 [Auriscalpium vulgare]
MRTRRTSSPASANPAPYLCTHPRRSAQTLPRAPNPRSLFRIQSRGEARRGPGQPEADASCRAATPAGPTGSGRRARHAMMRRVPGRLCT